MTSRSPLVLVLLLLLACGDDVSSGPDAPPGPPGPPGETDAASPDEPDAAPSDPDALPPDAAPPDAPAPDAAPDPVPALEREHAGGKPAAVLVVGGRAYVGVGPRLAIWDLAAGPTPTLVGESAPLPGIIESVEVAGDRAFVTAWNVVDGAVHVLDISDPSHPATTSSIRLATGTYSHPIALARSGTRLFVADSHEGVFELDISEPDAPVVTGHVDTHYPQRLQMVGDRLYLSGATFWDGVWLASMDISNGLSQVETGYWVPDVAAVSVTPSHRAVWVGGSGTRVDDVSDPGAPVVLFTSATMRSRAVVVDDGVAWIPTPAGLEVLDLSGANVTYVGSVPAPRAISGVGSTAGDHLALIGDRGELLSFDVGEPLAPALSSAGSLTICSPCVDVDAEGDVLVIATSGQSAISGVTTARLADLSALGQTPPILDAAFQEVVVQDGLAYVADWIFGLRVVDLSDPAHPTPVGAADTAGYPNAVTVSGDRAYIVEGTNGGWLRVLDVADPAHPAELAAMQTSRSWDVAAAGELVLVADGTLYGTGGLLIVDASDPAALQVVATYDPCGSADPGSVAVTGTIAVLGCPGGVELVDVTDPAAPVLAGSWSVPGRGAAAVAVRGDRVYVGHATGVLALDISDPTAPARVGERSTSWQVSGIAVPFPGRVLAATYLGGVYQWEL